MSMDRWPFVPDRLTEVLPEDLVRFIQSGSAVRMNVPVAIVELRPDPKNRGLVPHYIAAFDRWLKYSEFCRYLRDGGLESKRPAFPGGDKACEDFDGFQALGYLCGTLERPKDRLGRQYHCHMGICDLMAPIIVAGRPVAVMFGGQRRPTSEAECAAVDKQIQAIGTPDRAEIRIGTGTREELRRFFRRMKPYEPRYLDTLEKEAKQIAGFAEQQRELLKIQRQEEFLRTLLTDPPSNREALDRALQDLLGRVVDWCNVSFACMFVCEAGGDNLLRRLLAKGSAAEIASNPPHFNWAKAGLLPTRVLPNGGQAPEKLRNAIRGNQADDLRKSVEFIAPMSTASGHRAVFCLGGLPEGTHLDRDTEFLRRIARRLCGPYLEQLQILDLSQRNRLWEDTVSLIGHRVRGALTPIVAETDIIRLHLGGKAEWVTKERLMAAIEAVQAEADVLGESATEILEFWRWIIGQGERRFARRGLRGIVATCVLRLRESAARQGVKIEVEPGLQSLPEVDCIGGTLEIALTNVIENAIKYSSAFRYIEIKGRVDGNLVQIEIEDFGIGIPPAEREKVFDKGYRGKYRGKKETKRGEGLGLWQARQILRAHGGDITCTSVSKDRQPTPEDVDGFKTVFALWLPVEQKRLQED